MRPQLTNYRSTWFDCETCEGRGSLSSSTKKKPQVKGPDAYMMAAKQIEADRRARELQRDITRLLVENNPKVDFAKEKIENRRKADEKKRSKERWEMLGIITMLLAFLFGLVVFFAKAVVPQFVR